MLPSVLRMIRYSLLSGQDIIFGCTNQTARIDAVCVRANRRQGNAVGSHTAGMAMLQHEASSIHRNGFGKHLLLL